jgi:hypothetical protein
LGKSERRDSVPADYLSLRDAVSALVAAETSKQTLTIDQMSVEQVVDSRTLYDSLKAKLISAIREGSLIAWAWNRKDNRFLRLSTAVFSHPLSDMHFVDAQLFPLALPGSEKFLEGWVGLFEQKQFQAWLVEHYRSASIVREAEPKPHELKKIGRPSLMQTVIEKIKDLHPSERYPSVKSIRRELESANPPISVSETTIKRAMKAIKAL